MFSGTDAETSTRVHAMPFAAANSLILLDPENRLRAVFSHARSARFVRTARQAAFALMRPLQRSLWIAESEEAVLRLLLRVDWSALRSMSRRHRNLLVLSSAGGRSVVARRAVLTALFDQVVFATQTAASPIAATRGLKTDTPPCAFLGTDVLPEILSASHPGDYIIGGIVDTSDQLVVLYRGTLDALVVPFSFFRPTDNGVAPDFSDVEIVDFGQAVRFGAYEATADVLLYDYDAEYRRRTKRAERTARSSFGSAFRRLRLLKGLHQRDFAPVGERTIRRIENDVSQRLHPDTRRRIEARLGVSFDRIGSY